MRKLKLFFACLLMAVLSIGQVWATDIVIDLDLSKAATYPSGFPTASGTKTGTYTLGGYDFSFSCNDAFYFSTSYLMIGKSSKTVSSYITFPAIEDYKLTEVKLTASSGTSTNVAASIQDGSGNVLTGGTGWAFVQSGNNTWTLTETSANTAYKVCIYKNNTNNSTYNAQVAGLKLTYTPTGTTPPPAKTLTGVTVSGAPTKTSYYAGDNFDPAGLTVTGTYSDESTAPITSGITWSYDPSQELALNQTSIGVIATVSEITSAEYPVSITVSEAPAAATYEKVTSTENITDGDYLIVYEAGNVALNGALTSLDAVGNTVAVTINDGVITGSVAIDAATVTISTTAKTIQSASGYYIGITSYGNGLSSSTSNAYEHQNISIDGGNAVIYFQQESWNSNKNGKMQLCYNSDSNQRRFRYFKEGSQKAVQLYKKVDAAPAVAKPTISGTDNFLASTEVTIECTTDGAAIYYTTTESAKATPATSGDWMAYNGASKPSFSSTTTIWAAAKLGDDWSDVAEKTFTQATVLTTAAELVTFATTTEQQVYVNLANWKVNFVSGDYVYLVDASNEGVVLKQTGHGYSAGDVLADVAYQVNAKKSSGRVQLSGFTSENISATSGTASASDVTDFSTITAANQSALVTLKSATYSSSAGTFSDGEHVIYFYDQFNANPALVDGAKYDVTGIVIYYKNNTTEKIQIAPRVADDVVANQVVVIPTAANLAGLKAAEKGTYILTLTNAVVTYVNGKNAFIEEDEAGALIYFEGHGYQAGDCLNGNYQVNTEDYNGKFEITAMAPQAGAEKTTAAIPLTTLTIAQLEANFATYESRRVKIARVTVIDELTTSDRNGEISDGTNTFNLYAGIKETIVAAEDAFVDIIGYPGYNNTATQLTIWENSDIKVYQDAELSWGTTSFDAYIGQDNTFPTLTNDHNVTVVYSSTNTTAATIDENTGAITLGTTPNVSTVIKATLSNDATYKDAVVSYTLNVYNPTNPGTITYEENGGSAVADVTTPVENFPDPLPTTTRDLYIFDGWFTTSTFDENTEAVAGAPMDGNVTLYAKWIEIPVWAYTYTSNVEIESNTAAHVTIGGTDYDAAKTSKGASATITLPQGVTKIHLHLVAWSGEAQTVTVSGACFNEDKELAITDNSGVSGQGTTYDLGASGVDYYYSLTPDKAVAANEVITIDTEGNKRFVLFGVNQEGGVLPVLDHIAITGTMTNTTGWKTGDNIVPEGLTVNAYYTLNEVMQDPVDVTTSVVWSHDALIEDQTEVTLTATYTENTIVKSANVNVTIEAVETGDPTITTDVNSRSWTVDKDADIPAAKTFAVTLKNITSATITKGGDDPDAFSVTPATLTASGNITVSVVSTETVGTYTATITIKDDASETSKVVNVNLTVNAPETPETATSKTEWVVATNADLVDGAEVLIVGVNSTTSKVYAAGEQGSNNRAAVEASVDGEGVLTPGANTMSFTLVAQEGSTFALRTSNGKYLYAASSSKNYLRSQATVDDNAKWTLTATSASAEASSNNHVMQFNAGSSIFSCYSSDSQTDIQFYVPKPVVTYVAQIGETMYESLPAAVAAAQDGQTVNLLMDVAAGPGVMITTAEHKQIIIDFGNHTYCANSPAVGSAGTQNQAFHFEKGCNITLQNGTITSSGNEIKMLIQNYGDLTLLNITLIGTGLPGEHRYVLSNNCGNVVIGAGTTITAKEGDVAFDVCVTNYYPEGTQVTVENGATITGIVEYDVWGTKPADNKATLTIEGGNFDITWNVEPTLAEDAKDNINVEGGTFSAEVPADYCAPGYIPEDNGSGQYGVHYVGYYERGSLTPGNYATICLPNGGKISGASLFDIEYCENSTLYLLEVEGNTMVAGRPYIFLPSVEKIKVIYTDAENATAGSFNGLVGSLSLDAEVITPNDGNYILYNNQYWYVNSLAYVGANRAYIHMDGVPTQPSQQQGAPRRRVAMQVNGQNTTTGVDNLNAGETPVKVMINGQLFILRGEKMYNANGQLVK